MEPGILGRLALDFGPGRRENRSAPGKPGDSGKDEPMKTRQQAIADIAFKLGVGTLETRRSDSLDFYDLHVANIREALERAYDAGRAAGGKQ